MSIWFPSQSSGLERWLNLCIRHIWFSGGGVHALSRCSPTVRAVSRCTQPQVLQEGQDFAVSSNEDGKDVAVVPLRSSLSNTLDEFRAPAAPVILQMIYLCLTHLRPRIRVCLWPDLYRWPPFCSGHILANAAKRPSSVFLS